MDRYSQISQKSEGIGSDVATSLYNPSAGHLQNSKINVTSGQGSSPDRESHISSSSHQGARSVGSSKYAKSNTGPVVDRVVYVRECPITISSDATDIHEMYVFFVYEIKYRSHFGSRYHHGCCDSSQPFFWYVRFLTTNVFYFCQDIIKFNFFITMGINTGCTRRRRAWWKELGHPRAK